MKLTFLGTGAGEGYPGLWCRCPHCAYARKTGGRNLRANSCAVVDDTLLLDIGPMCFDRAAQYGIDLTGITTLLITHPHPDHLYARHLHWREVNDAYVDQAFVDQMHLPGPRFTPLPELQIFGNAFTEKALAPVFGETLSPHASFHLIREGEAFDTDGYHVTPVRGNHHEKGFAHSFVIQKDGKTFLYALDTGGYDPDQMEILYRFTYDVVIMEGTTGLNVLPGGHMCLTKNRDFKADLIAHRCLSESSRMFLTHMSPHWCPPHDMYVFMADAYGIQVAYDGLTIEI